jgi:acetyltransferase-like isoleucine patch superfamily enzyme
MRRPNRRALVEARERRAARRLVQRTNDAFLPPPARAYASYGAKTVVVPPTRIEGTEFIDMGAGVMIHEHVWLLAQRRPHLPPPTLRIGDKCHLNRFVKIVSLGSVQLGEGVLVGDRVYISDVEYLPWGEDADSRPMTEPKPVVIHDRALLGVAVVVKPGVTIGAEAYIGAGAVIEEDVPEGGLVVGNPARLIRLRNPETGEWERV